MGGEKEFVQAKRRCGESLEKLQENRKLEEISI